jgi:NADPH:quinone reductase-like Zn-dependent oxidoreductase
MKAVQMQGYGGPEMLQTVEVPEPPAQAGRVRVRVRAAAVNPVDWMTRSGALAAFFPVQPPVVLGWDLAGALLDDAGELRAGQRVAGMIPWFALAAVGAPVGAYADVVLVDPAWLAPVPDELDDVSAAALPLNAQTARQALDLLGVSMAQTVLITGASGAVGGFAVQLAAAAGARVIAVASTGDQEYVSSLGAKEVLGRGDAAQLVDAVRRLVPGGVDRVLDAAAAGPALIAAVRDSGRFLSVLDPVTPQPERDVTVVKVSVEPNRAQLVELVDAAAAGRLVVRIADTLPLTQAAQAHIRAARGAARGKIVLTN